MSRTGSTARTRPSARAVLAQVAAGFREFAPPEDGGEAADGGPDGPLGWPGYDAARERARERTGERESVVCGTGLVGETEAVLLAFEFGFLGGSLGARTGDLIEAAYTVARERRLPVVSLVATGGSRMQEGMRALGQLQRVAQQAALTRAAGLPQVAVVRDPATGGGWATLAAGADVVLGLPGAQAGFAGSRVRPAAADPAAYTVEGQYAAGHLDRIVPEPALGAAVTDWLTLLTGGSADPAAAPVPYALPRAGEAGRGAGDVRGARGGPATNSAPGVRGGPAPGTGSGQAPGAPSGRPPGAPDDAAPDDAAPGAPREMAPGASRAAPAALPRTGTEAVERARAAGRPRAAAYLDAYFAGRREIRGDRCGGVDPGVACGFGVTRDGRTVAYAAQRGTPTRPAGYRTAARLIRMAGRLGIPVLTLIDTPGAANGPEAERAGAGPAINDAFTALAEATVPVTSLLIGEGGSGGALALAAPGNLWVTPDSYFSVIAPELAAAILKRGQDRVPETADALRLRPQDAVELGAARGIAPPAPDGA